MNEKYTFQDIIIDPHDPRLKDAIGKECWLHEIPVLLVQSANRGNPTKKLERVRDYAVFPFFSQLHEWSCLIIKRGQEESDVGTSVKQR